MNIKKLFESVVFQKIIVGVGIALAVLVVFQAGVFVGFHKAGASYHMGDSYYRVFGDDSGPLPRELVADFSDAHGTAGKVVSVHLPTFIVEDKNQEEKVVAITDDTVIRRLRGSASTSAITAGEFVVVIGEPNEQSELQATLVRLVPPPPAN